MLLISVGCATFYAMSAMMPSVRGSLHVVYDRLRLSDYTVMVDAAPVSVVDDIEGLDPVRYAYGRAHLSGLVVVGGQNVTADLLGFNATSMPTVNNISVTDGQYLDPDSPDSVLLEQRFAEEHGIGPGDNLTVTVLGRRHNFTVRGQFLSPQYVLSAVSPMAVYPTAGSLAVIVLPLETLQQLLGLPGHVNEFCVVFEDGVDREAAMSEVDDVLRDYGVRRTMKREDMFGYSFVETDLAYGDEFIGLLSGIIIAVAFFVSFSAMHRLVRTQRREIGVLRGLGYSQRSVLAGYIVAAVVFGLQSSIVGVLLAIPIAVPLSQEYMTSVSGFPLQEMVYPVTPFYIAIAIGPVATAMAMIAAAWSATHVPPHHAIRGEMVDMRPARATLVERGLGRVGWALSYPSRYVFRQTSRRRLRSALVVVAISVSMTVGATGPVIMSSVAGSFEYALTVHDNWDFVVSFSHHLLQSEVDDLDLAHAETVVPILRSGAHVAATSGESGNRSASIVALPWENSLHVPEITAGSGLGERGSILLVPRLAHQLGVEVGDTVTVFASGNSTELEVTGITSDILGDAVMRLDDARDLLGAPVASGAFVRASAGHDEELREELYRRGEVVMVQGRAETISGMRRMLEYFSDIVQVFTLLGILMTVLIVGNIVLIGSLERRSEYALMRALGFGGRTIAGVVAGETVLLTVVGILLGIPMTWVLNTWLEVQPLMQNIFPAYHVFFDWPQVVGTGVVILVTALLATVPSVRMLLRMPVHTTIRERQIG